MGPATGVDSDTRGDGPSGVPLPPPPPPLTPLTPLLLRAWKLPRALPPPPPPLRPPPELLMLCNAARMGVVLKLLREAVKGAAVATRVLLEPVPEPAPEVEAWLVAALAVTGSAGAVVDADADADPAALASASVVVGLDVDCACESAVTDDAAAVAGTEADPAPAPAPVAAAAGLGAGAAPETTESSARLERRIGSDCAMIDAAVIVGAPVCALCVLLFSPVVLLMDPLPDNDAVVEGAVSAGAATAAAAVAAAEPAAALGSDREWGKSPTEPLSSGSALPASATAPVAMTAAGRALPT